MARAGELKGAGIEDRRLGSVPFPLTLRLHFCAATVA